MRNFLLILSTVTLLLTGCGAGTNQSTPSPQVQQTAQKSPDYHMDLSRHAKQLALRDKRVEEAAAVATDKELSVAVKVSNFNRLKLNDIRKDIHGKLSKTYPKYDIYVTTDSKVFSELQKLESSIKKSTPPKPEQVKSKLKKLNDDMKG